MIRFLENEYVGGDFVSSQQRISVNKTMIVFVQVSNFNDF